MKETHTPTIHMNLKHLKYAMQYAVPVHTFTKSKHHDWGHWVQGKHVTKAYTLITDSEEETSAQAVHVTSTQYDKTDVWH